MNWSVFWPMIRCMKQVCSCPRCNGFDVAFCNAILMLSTNATVVYLLIKLLTIWSKFSWWKYSIVWVIQLDLEPFVLSKVFKCVCSQLRPQHLLITIISWSLYHLYDQHIMYQLDILGVPFHRYDETDPSLQICSDLLGRNCLDECVRVSTLCFLFFKHFVKLVAHVVC